MRITKTNLLMFIKENKNKIIIAFILAVIATGIVCYIIFNNFFLTNSFAMEANINNFITYFVKIGVIFIGIYLFSLSVVLHNKKSVKLLCYCYLTLLFFLFFIKGIYLYKPFRGFPKMYDFIIKDFSLIQNDLDGFLNIVMPIPIYAIFVYLLNDKKKAFIIGLLSILLIEPIQLITNFGNFEITDSYQNLVGYSIGVVIYHIMFYIKKNKKAKSR